VVPAHLRDEGEAGLTGISIIYYESVAYSQPVPCYEFVTYSQPTTHIASVCHDFLCLNFVCPWTNQLQRFKENYCCKDSENGREVKLSQELEKLPVKREKFMHMKNIEISETQRKVMCQSMTHN
jgi:hypothetical protein